MLPTRIWEFLIGAYAAWFVSGSSTSKIKNYAGILSLLSVILVIAFYPLRNDSLSVYTGHPGVAAILIVIATTVVLIARIDEVIGFENWLAKFFVRLGDYSYSIYLTHFPIIVLVNYTPFGGTVLGFQSALDLIAILAITAFASYFMFNYVETLRYRKPIFLPLIALVFVGVTVGILGPHLNKLSTSSEQLKVFNAWQDRSSYRCGKIKRILSPTATTCLLSESISDSRVLLLGNSHADSLKVAFADAMSEYNIATYFFVANNPLMSSKTSEKIVYKDVVEYEIDSVVIHYSSSFYGSPENINRLNKFLNLMKSIEATVFFIAPVPVYDVHVPKSMIKVFNETGYKFPDKNLDDYFLSSNDFFKFVEKSDIDDDLITLPHAALCPSDRCLYEIGGSPFYFDGGHLTLTGARMLAPLLGALAQRLIN